MPDTQTPEAPPAIRNVVIGTAGHIDHGKSTLVQALTGKNPTRLAEELERGMTIDLGFSNFVFEGKYRIGMIDVPGHEAFVKNMIAGATGIDGATCAGRGVVVGTAGAGRATAGCGAGAAAGAAPTPRAEKPRTELAGAPPLVPRA